MERGDREERLFHRAIGGIAAAILVAGCLLWAILPPPAGAFPAWWDASWPYRTLIRLTENSGTGLTNYPVKIELSAGTFDYSKVEGASGEDLRLVTGAGTVCDYWIQTWNTSGTSIIWVEIPSLPASSTLDLYMYYGKEGASAASSDDDTFSKDYGESGLAALWHMDEGSGTTTGDSSGNGNTATFRASGEPAWVGSDGGQWDGRSDVTFANGDSLLFDGSNDRLSVSDSPSLGITEDITLEAWVKPTWSSYPDWGLIYSDWYNDTNRAVHFSLYYGRVSLWISSTGANYDNLDGTTQLPLNQWSHIAATFDSGTFNVYVNGQPDNSQKVSETVTSIFNSTYTKTIGIKNQGGSYVLPFKGYIDELRTYSRALSAEEIRCHYERRKYVSTEPTAALGAEETVGSWSDTFAGIGSVESATNVAVSSGSCTLSGGALSGSLTSDELAPNDFCQWSTFTATHNIPSGTGISYRILDASDSSTLCTVSATQAAAGYDISSCAGPTDSIRAYAELTATVSGQTPRLDSWTLTWTDLCPPAIESMALWSTGTGAAECSTITPQAEYNLKVSVRDNNTLSDLSTLKITLYFDADGTYNPAEVPSSGNTQTAAILLWTNGGSPAWSISSGTSTSWAIVIENCSAPSLGEPTGTFEFHFKAGKVAAATPGASEWHLYALADDGLYTDNAYLENIEMNWYGEITTITPSFGFGTVPLGCSGSPSGAVSVTCISNGDYRLQVKSAGSWTGPSGSVTLCASGTAPAAGEFALMADDDATLEGAAQVQSETYAILAEGGTSTGEAGVSWADNHFWLWLADTGILPEVFVGTVYLRIAEAS